MIVKAVVGHRPTPETEDVGLDIVETRRSRLRRLSLAKVHLRTDLTARVDNGRAVFLSGQPLRYPDRNRANIKSALTLVHLAYRYGSTKL